MSLRTFFVGSLMLFNGSALMAQDGPVDSVFIEDLMFFGNRSTQGYVFEHLLLLDKGQTIPASSLETLLKGSVDNLYDLRIFLKVNVQVKPGSAPASRIIIFTIVERPKWYYSYPILYQDVYGWIYGQRTLLLNLTGRGGETRISLLGGGFREVELDFFFPAFLGTHKIFARFNGYYNGFDYVFDDDPGQRSYPPDFTVDRFGGFTEIGINITHRLGLGARFGIEEVQVDRPGVTFNGARRDRFVTFGGFIENEKRDYKYFAMDGTYYRVGFNLNRNDNIDFEEFYFDFRKYFPITEKGSLAFQVFSDVLTGEIPVYRRFHIGGSTTMRGYERKSLDGESIGYISTEYRVPFAYKRSRHSPVDLGLAGHIFVDYGAAWYDNRDISLEDFEVSTGVGIQVIARRNSARLEIGWAREVGLFAKAGSRVKF